MRTFVIILLFVAIGCYAGDTSDITSKVFEKKDKDGKISFRMVTTCRGKTKVMMEVFRPNAQGVLAISARSYLAGGDLVTTESDEHKSGKFDTVAVYHPGTDEMEVFTRQADGSVKPASTQTLQAYKKQNAAVSDFIGTMWTNTNASDEEISERIQATQKKIQDVEKQKTDGKQ
jgi:outer membrane lipoprotein-sorting protein